MNAPRIAELLAPFLAQDQTPAGALLEHISIYIDILLRWNERLNLTAIRDPEQIVTRHFGESLFAARHLFPDRVGTQENTESEPDAPGNHEPANDARANGARENAGRENGGRENGAGANGEREDVAKENGSRESRGRAAGGAQENGARENRGRAALQGGDTVHPPKRASAPVNLADVGSGAGFPGIPIKLWAPEISLTLIESNHKKATFLREVARALILTDINIQTARAETLPHAAFDLVTLRAVERFESILPAAAALLRPAGRLAILIGTPQIAQAQSLLPEHEFDPPMPIPLSRSRMLLLSTSRVGEPSS